MTASEQLQAALDRLEGGKYWTKGTWSTREKANGKDFDYSIGCSMCASGALHAVADAHYTPMWEAARGYLLAAMCEQDPSIVAAFQFNDRDATRFEDIDRAFRRAIELAQAGEGTVTA